MSGRAIRAHPTFKSGSYLILIPYWSKRNSKLYDSETSKSLKRQNHKCGEYGLKMLGDERVNLHHVDGNHSNSKINSLLAVHSHLSRLYSHEQKRKLRTSGSVCGEIRTYISKWEGQGIISPLHPTNSQVLLSSMIESLLPCNHKIALSHF